MSIFRTFFENLDFSFEQDFVLKEIEFSKNKSLTKKIQNNIYFYEAPENVNTSFYFFDILDLNDDELFELKRYVWNENKCEFYFYPDNINVISLYYAKSNPKRNIERSKIDSFTGKDNDEIENIKKWRFDTGAFWLSYEEYAKKIKSETQIDKLLIDRLIDLKKELLTAFGKNKEDYVQSLIDRTLFIKFLEDNHIINSFFYQHYFDNKEITYKQLLYENNTVKINSLFEKINEVFDNVLFKTPDIEDEYILKSSKFIYNAISGETKGQLSLFDFQFDIIPIEFISHIYEVFLESKQANEGIYYTPPKLAQLIIDETITEHGKVLDPACGSGMFLILAFRKMLNENSTNDKSISENIKVRLKLLKENIFGIEKQYTAWRLSIFALYLEIFNGLKPDDIKEFIANKIKSGNIKIFDDFSTNIINGNSLEVQDDKAHFKNKTFNYIVGNPPFLQISKNDEEINFLNKYETTINDIKISAKSVIGKNQISQAFMLKIKDWANDDTKFGFVLNSSNFYNEGKSIKFQEFFFKNYQIKNFYELSRVKKILFKKASESVVVVIFNNKQVDNNFINYYPINLELFSETFNILVIKEDNRIEIKQNKLLNKNITLRELLIGNKYDLKILNKLKEYPILKSYILQNTPSHIINNGLQIVGKEQLIKEFNISENLWNSLSRIEKKSLSDKFKSKYISNKKNKSFKTPLISPINLNNFHLTKVNQYVNNISNFHRKRNTHIYFGKKILINRVGLKLKAFYSKDDLYFNFDIYSFVLKNKEYYHLITSILNSELINYFIDINYRKRGTGSYPKISYDAIKNIPIPIELDNNIAKKITELSKELTDGKLKYENGIKDELNELIYDLYDLNYLERQRIKDFYISKRKIKKTDIEKYTETLLYTLEMYFEHIPLIDYSIDLKFGFDMMVVGIFFNKNEKMPKTEKVLKYEITKIMQETNNNILAMREFLFGKNCIYIVKDRQLKNWTETKAYEDGKLILKHLS